MHRLRKGEGTVTMLKLIRTAAHYSTLECCAKDTEHFENERKCVAGPELTQTFEESNKTRERGS